MKYTYAINILILCLALGVSSASACGLNDAENCPIRFLDLSEAIPTGTPPMRCNDTSGLEGYYELPTEWHCRQPINSAFEPIWCRCELHLSEAQDAYLQSLNQALPASIPNERWLYILSSMDSDEQSGSCRQAIQDWKFCGDTVDGLNVAHDYWKGKAAEWKAKYEASIQ